MRVEIEPVWRVSSDWGTVHWDMDLRCHGMIGAWVVGRFLKNVCEFKHYRFLCVCVLGWLGGGGGGGGWLKRDEGEGKGAMTTYESWLS